MADNIQVIGPNGVNDLATDLGEQGLVASDVLKESDQLPSSFFAEVFENLVVDRVEETALKQPHPGCPSHQYREKHQTGFRQGFESNRMDRRDRQDFE